MGTPDHRLSHIYVHTAYNKSLPRLGVAAIAGAWSGVNELTSGFVSILLSSWILSEKFQELFLFNFEVIGKLFRGQVVRQNISEGVPLPFEQFEGEEVILWEGAGPGPVGLLDRFVERLSFEDEGGEFDGPVGRGSQAALGGGDEAGCGVQAYGVAEEAGYVAGVFGCDPKFRPGGFFFGHGFTLTSLRRVAAAGERRRDGL
jgi:hypothetical protein